MSTPNERPLKRRKVQDSTLILRKENSIINTVKSKWRQSTYFFLTADAALIFSSYFRLVYHLIGISIILFIVFQCICSFSKDVQERYNFEVEGVIQKARECHQKYITHNCGPNLKGAVWKNFCDEWDLNFHSDKVSHSKVAAQVFGELMNGFVEPLSLKAMIIIFLVFFGFFIVSMTVGF